MKFIFFSIILHLSILTFGLSIYKPKKQPILELKTNFDTAKISFNSDSFESNNEPIEEKIEEKIEKSINSEILENSNNLILKSDLKSKALVEKKILKKITKKNENSNKSENKNKNKILTSTDVIEISDGIFAARNQGVDGLKYSFISQPEPNYPLAAKRIGFNNEISIKVRFLVDFKGNIEEIKFYNTKDNLGFQNEVQKTLKNWKLTPVSLNGKPIKLYFYKEFKFNQKQI
ncbi:MAG: energy transducer TonB [Cetobacterium sp.]